MKHWIQPASDVSLWDVLLRLTLIDLLLRPAGPWGILPFILLTSCAGLISTRVLRAPLTWLALFLLICARIAADWPMPDNHIYLLAYWCLAVSLSLYSPTGRFTLETSSRLLLGFAFALAVIWKGILSPDFTDGRFFRVTLLTDPRFAGSVLLFGGLTKDQLKENREYLNPLPAGAELLNPPKFINPPAFRFFALVSTWGILALEAAVAILFLLPGQRLYWGRHIILLFFCLITYPFAPVAGFGWLLLVMGMALCKVEHRALKGAYIAMFFFILLLSEIPWTEAVVQTMQNNFAQ